ncbi:GntR family transcriptional regulator [Streptomyces sp. NPDC085866]|uniref:GntR family transcriptional regulator n=1 Tax=Streptomyces sp. NPDC085866 TaxID=3365736 RepID=UPI0037D6F7D3
MPGEHALAQRFGGSRTTVRAALAEPAEEGLITTRTGKGSYVLCAGRPPAVRRTTGSAGPAHRPARASRAGCAPSPCTSRTTAASPPNSAGRRTRSCAWSGPGSRSRTPPSCRTNAAA